MKTSPEGAALSSSEAAVRELFAEMENILPHPNEPHGRAATRVRLAMENVRCAFKSEVSPIPATVEAGVVERALEAYEAIVFTAHASRRKREAMRAALEAAGLLPSTPAWRGIEPKWMADMPTLSMIGHGDNEVTLAFSNRIAASDAYDWLEAGICAYLDLEEERKRALPSSPVSGGEEE